MEPYIIKQADGTIIGLDNDILNLINKNTGANFQLTSGTWGEMVAKLKAGDIDGVSTSSRHFADAHDYLYSKPYFTVQKALIVADTNPKNIQSVQDLAGKRVGYQADNQFNKSLLDRYEGVIAVPMNSLSEVVDALIVGDIDATIEANIIYHVDKAKSPFMKTVALIPDSTLDLLFSFRADYPEAISIINKGLAAISRTSKMEIENRWFFIKTEISNESEYKSIVFTEAEKKYLDTKAYITVGSMNDFAPFDFIKDGKPSGYTVEFMRLIAQQLGKEVRFATKPWNEQMHLLSTGSIDVIPHIAVTPERRERVEYTNFNHLIYSTGFAVRKGETIRSMLDLNGKIVAVLEKSFLHSYLAKHFPDINLLLVDRDTKGIAAVSNDEAYAVIGSLPGLTYYIQLDWRSNLKIINVKDAGVTTKTELPMGVVKGNVILKSLLEKANSAIPEEKIQKLKQKWIFASSDFSLNRAEQNFIAEHPIIRFGIRSDRPPFELLRDGKPAGIAVDYLSAIASHAGFKAEFVVNNLSLAGAMDMVEGTRHDFDTLAFSVKNRERALRFAFGESYLSYPMMIITHKNSPFIGKMSDLNGKLVAIEKGYLTNKWLANDYPEIQIINVPSSIKALEMVNNEKADAYIGNVAVANYMAVHGQLNNLKISAPSGYGSIDYSFIAPKEWPELASILSKAYLALPANFHTDTQQKWFSFQMVETTNYTLLWLVLSITLVIILVVLWWNRTLRREKKKTEIALTRLRRTQNLLKKNNETLKKLSITDKLTGLYNRAKLDRVLQQEQERSLRYGNIFAVILIDIDYFKGVNDRYGHQAGDSVLVEFANILTTNIRHVDTVGRWGGEEFLVICPETSKEGVYNLAENLRKNISVYNFSDVGCLTASFGVSLYQEGDSAHSIIAKADVALYNSKESGRNRVTIN
ncbi:transporter substrate-binding domain-containing protein [Psychromonas sp. MME1]|uniref:transporter substrate-binding domain-containing diguanylate cyclase n=1 Tax=Psychromonas sp. MME1 TaxID=3231032 RepID=UPI0034E2B836